MDKKDFFIVDNLPRLRQPYFICGIDGWVNGGNVASGGVDYLIRQFSAVKFARFHTPHFHVYQIPGAESLRPMFKMEEGLILDVNMPRDEFFYAITPQLDHDLVFFTGTEPNLYWDEYTDAIASLATEYKAARLYTFGGILDRSPYTRSPRISCTCTSGIVKNELEKYNVSFSSRQGSASFNLMLLYACMKNKVEGANFTVRVPYYPEFNVAIEYGFKSIKAVLARLNGLMQLHLDFTELDNGAAELDGKLDFVRQQNAQFNTYIEELEKHYVEMPYEDQLDISPNEAVRFAEEFLKGNKDKPKGN
jgi:proteasome assembly chaperone (PAC2) family protein